MVASLWQATVSMRECAVPWKHKYVPVETGCMFTRSLRLKTLRNLPSRVVRERGPLVNCPSRRVGVCHHQHLQGVNLACNLTLDLGASPDVGLQAKVDLGGMGRQHVTFAPRGEHLH